jgi:hypothetical protein
MKNKYILYKYMCEVKDITKEKKFAVMYHDITEKDTEIIRVFRKMNEALEFTSILIKGDPDITEWHKVEYENNTWSIYELHYLFKKTIVGKYIIKPYFDETN